MDYMHPYVDCSVIYNSEDWNQPVSIGDEWVKKAVAHLDHGMILSHKKGKFTLCNNMDEPGEYYAR